MAKVSKEVKSISERVVKMMKDKNRGFILSYMLVGKLNTFLLPFSLVNMLGILTIIFKVKDYYLSIPLAWCASVFLAIFIIYFNLFLSVRSMVYSKMKTKN